MVTIVNYGMGNLGSILNMFKRVKVVATITSSADEIAKAKKILLPGVGAFDMAMTKIKEAGIREVLDQKALVEKVPVLGICLGMQLLTNSSEEGNLSGLGWISAKTLAFKNVLPASFKVPHMGWNTVSKNAKSVIVDDLPERARFYFVHSYYVKCDKAEHVLLSTKYGIDFDSAIQKDNIFGAQFHPEKSHKFGMKVLENFAKI